MSDDVRRKVAVAFWTLKNMSTAEGRSKFGPRFWNYDDIIMIHVCSLYDPRCDQGHFGPQFMTFHRMLLLRIELALLSVDPTIEAMPYWNVAFDAQGGKYFHDPLNFIFSERFFGSAYGKGANYAVTDGLFANWSVGDWTAAKFGNQSWMAEDLSNKCIRESWFRPARAQTCDRCCSSSSWLYAKADNTDVCECSDGDHFRIPFRNHPDCTPYVNRWPETPLLGFGGHIGGSRVDLGNGTFLPSRGFGGTFDIQYTSEDFDACAEAANTATWMAWQNCIEASFPYCGKGDNPFSKNAVHSKLATLVLRAAAGGHGFEAASAALAGALKALESHIQECKQNLSFVGYYDTLAEGAQLLQGAPTASAKAWLTKASHHVSGLHESAHKRRYVNGLHTGVHIRLGLDFGDVCTSPHEVGPFAGLHSAADRNNFHWMYNQRALQQQDYFYPSREEVSPITSGIAPWGLNGPWGVAGASECATSFTTEEYNTTFYPLGYDPWLPGTLAHDVVNAGFPFKDMFDCKEDAPTGESCTGGTHGYTHHEVLYWTAPQRTPYTYDTLEHLYY